MKSFSVKINGFKHSKKEELIIGLIVEQQACFWNYINPMFDLMHDFDEGAQIVHSIFKKGNAH